MKIEHLALNVEDPVKMAKWYSQNLGFTILKEMKVSPFAHFIADESKHILLEIFRLPDKEPADYRSSNPDMMHLAFSTENIEVQYQKLILAGAVEVSGGVSVLKNGDKIAMLRDPWGLPIQLVSRNEVMI